jgi:hypothetical protein
MQTVNEITDGLDWIERKKLDDGACKKSIGDDVCFDGR